MRSGLVERITSEVAHHQAGRPARIRIKANSVVDEAIIDELYVASRAGVPVELLVRGICALRPRVPGLSETIRVRSVLGRFLEHSRVFWFENGGDPAAWIGSADLMHRNLDRRVEVLVRLPGEAQVEQVGEHARPRLRPGHLRPGSSTPTAGGPARPLPTGSPLVDLQSALIAEHRRRARPDALGPERLSRSRRAPGPG